MNPFRKLAFLCGAASLAVLAGCHPSQAPDPQETANEAASDIADAGAGAGPDAKPGIAGSRGRLILPVVPGRPAAAYFSLRNDGPAAVKLTGIHVEGAGKAEMHRTSGGSMNAVDSVGIAPGATITFAPGGYHVMVFDPAAALRAGDSTELALTFSDGEKLSMPLRIEGMGHDASGEGMDDMPGMQH